MSGGGGGFEPWGGVTGMMECCLMEGEEQEWTGVLRVHWNVPVSCPDQSQRNHHHLSRGQTEVSYFLKSDSNKWRKIHKIVEKKSTFYDIGNFPLLCEINKISDVTPAS